VHVNQGQAWFEQPRNEAINYTGQLTLLMRDVVARVPTLGFIDLSRILVFARPGRSSADGAYASCHSLGLPVSEPGYFFWRDRSSGVVTRRTEWFVTKSPVVRVGNLSMNYMISFALPRFTDQTLARSRKRVLYPQGTADWVAKLDTVIHELYHVDPAQTCLRRFTRKDGTASDALHNETYFEDVAALVQQYLASDPDRSLLEFLHYDFDGLRARYGAIAGAAFRTFPSYPRRYREVVEGPSLPADLQHVPVERVIDGSVRVFGDSDLQLREFTGTASRSVELYPDDVAA
jgi:hypothetical protein